MQTLEKSKKFISFFLIAILLSLQLFQTSSTLGAKPITRYSLVAILVDENLWLDSNKYQGLSNENSKVSPATLKYRILRYAEDIQNNLPYTKTNIVLTSANESTVNIATALEKYYRTGDGTEDEINSLSGVVLVGDIPLPVVNKNQNRFPSLYPYTDFDDKLYIYDENQDEFILNEEVQNPQVEVWHGVIKPPKNNDEGKKMLAEYFDKNHLFRIGDIKYGQFDEKIFYGDLTREVKSLNAGTFLAYQNLQKYAEDKTYMRYTKELAQKIYTETNKKIFDFGDDQDNDGDNKKNEDPNNGIDDDGDGEDGSPLHGLIDGIDNDNDGDIDEEDEGFYGVCNGVFQNCATGQRKVEMKFGAPYYSVQKNSKYKVADSEDNNADGITDEGIDEDDGDPYLNVDNDLDGKIDEDTDQDNDKDKDGKSSEDPPGDKNGDGCPGVCLVDEDLDQQDSDGDGFPNGDEIESGTDPLDSEDYPNLSHIFIFKIPRFIPDANRDNPHYSNPKRKNWVDEWPNSNESSCYDSAGKFHPEWDDDEDGKCDEDGTADDDNDGDGKIDEDKKYIQQEIAADNFKHLPDIDSRNIIENYFSEFPSLVQKYLAQVNKYNDYTGRWQRDDSNVDDFSSIIGKRDTANRTYFLLLNTALEKSIDSVVEGVQSKQPIVTQARIANSKISITESGKKVTLNSNPNIEFTAGQIDFFSGNVEYINGVKYQNIKDPLECSLFRGTSGKVAAGSKLVLFNKIYNPVAPKDKDGKVIEENKDDYGYCIGKYYDSPSVCVPEKAKKPIMDFGGSLKMDDWYASATDYRACFDLKEKKHFEEILQNKDGNISVDGRSVKYIGRYQSIVENRLNKQKELIECKDKESDPANCKIQVPALPKEENRPLFRDRYKPLKEIIVFNDSKRKITITLADIAKALNIEADDFLTFNEQIFNTGNPSQSQKTLTINNPLGNGSVNSITLTIDRIIYAGGNANPVIIPTLVKHKAPFSFEGAANISPYSADQAISTQLSQHTAKDLPVDSPRYLTFKDKNNKFHKIVYPNIFKAKSAAEAKLMVEVTANQIAALPGAPSDTKQKILKILDDFSQKNQLNQNIQWRNLNIDQKHQLIFTKYLTASTDVLFAPQSGYEAAYLVLNGQDNKLEYAINPDIPEVDENPTIKFPKSNIPKNQDSSQNQESEIKPIMLFDWFAHIIEWMKTVNFEPRVTMMCQYDGDKLIESDPAVPVNVSDSENDDSSINVNSYDISQLDKNNDGILDAAQLTNNLSIEIENNILLADNRDSTKVYVYGNDSSNKRNYADGHTQVELQIIKGSESIKILSNKAKTLAGGKAEFDLGSTLTPGEITIKALSINLNKSLSTNTAKIITSDRQIKLSSFIKPQSAPGDANAPVRKLKNILILDEKDKKIVRVKAFTGEIEVLDTNYILQVSPSKNDDPVKTFIINKNNNQRVGVIMYVPFTDKLTEQKNKDFVTTETFVGTNYKLFSGSDQYDIKKGSDSIKFYEKKTAPPLLKAEITKNGQIFLDKNLRLNLKPVVSASDYQTLIINDGNDILAEVLIAADYENINLITTENAINEYLSSINIQAGPKLEIEDISQNTNSLTHDSSNNWLFKSTNAQQVIKDSDGDGLTDFQEFIIGTNPDKKDSDGDGNSDDTEIFNNYDPLKPNEKLFSDLNTSDEAFGSIINLYLKGILRGYEDKTFKPNKFITREEFVKVDLSSACFDCTRYEPKKQNEIWQKYNESPFPDNNITDGLKYCIADGKNRSIIQGYKGKDIDGFFLPSKNISRAEATKVIMLTAGLPIPDNILDGKPWHYNYVIGAMQAGIYPKNKFAQIDNNNVGEFKTWFNQQITEEGNFVKWLREPITRGEFSIMVANVFTIKNCWIQDNDGDGLNNAAETDQYGTDPNNRDTDNGGVDDYTEIINKMNPLDAIDDKEYLASAKPISSPIVSLEPDISKDSDEDGISDVEEKKLGTDPNNIDSDGGGKSDYDETNVYKTDPLDASDDNDVGIRNISQGFHAAAYKIIYDYVTLPTDSEINSVGENVYYTDEILADGKSTITVRAQLQDLNGEPISNDHTSQIRLIPQGNSNDYASIKGTGTQKTANGKADFTVVSKTKSGTYKLKAVSLNNNIPSSESQIFVYPDNPDKITFVSQSSQIRADNNSTIEISANLFDKNGNLADYGIYPINLKVSGPGEIINIIDEDTSQDGDASIDTKVLNGKLSFQLKSKNNPGQISITATYTNSENKQISATTKLKAVENIKLKLAPKQTALPADGKSKTEIQISAIDQNNILLKDFTGKVELSLGQSGMGDLSKKEVLLVDGESTIDFTSSTQTGEISINAVSNLLSPATTKINLQPLPVPSVLKVYSEQNNFDADSKNTIKISAKVYDQFGNHITNLNSGKMQIAATNATQDFVNFPKGFESTVKNGTAEFIISPTDITGPINLVVSLDNLLKAGIQLNSVNKITAEDFYRNPPNVMHISILGTDAGNTETQDYLAGSMVFSKGKTLAATSLLTQPYNYETVINIKNTGRNEIINIGKFESQITSDQNSSPNILFYNSEDKSAIGKLFVRFNQSDSIFKEKKATSGGTSVSSASSTNDDNISSLTSNDPSGVYVFPISGQIKTSVTSNEMQIWDANNLLATINNNGSITINQPGITLLQNYQNQDLSLTLTGNKQGNIADIVYHFKSPQINIIDIKADKQKLPTGIYFAKAENIAPYTIIQTYSGNSNRTKSGLKIVDTRFKDNSLSSPGMGYLSLEDSENAEAVGFREGNKHMLLLAAGNIIGEANKPYASEIGIVIGDPTLKFKNQNQPSKTGYTKDIGIQLLSGTEEIQSITKLDYNSDGLQDLFIAYKDGRVRLLENEYSYKHFKDQGIILNLTSGIRVIEKGDLDNDGYEDLVIVTQNSCKVGEVCVYWYQNKEGVFKPYNLNLNTAQNLHDLKVGDLNKDGYADIVTSDYSNQIMAFYSNKGKFDFKGDLIANLDLNIDESENLIRSVAVSYQGMPKRNESDFNSAVNYRDIPVTVQKQNNDASNALNQFSPGTNVKISASNPTESKLFTFIFADSDPSLKTSIKKATDVNGSPLNDKDQIRYEITLKNTGKNDITDLMLNEAVSGSASIDYNTIKCVDCGSQKPIVDNVDDPARPLLIKNIDIPAGSSRTIQYTAVLSTTLPKYDIMLGNNIDSGYPKDNYLDIMVKPQNNTSGKVLYYYSSGIASSSGKVIYSKYLSQPQKTKLPELPFLKDGKVDLGKENDDGVPENVIKQQELLAGDSDNDLIPDMWDSQNGELTIDLSNITNDLNKTLDEAGKAAEDALKDFFCGGSCLPFPISISWLSPGPFNVMGTPAGYDPGTPLVGAAIPSPPYVCFGQSCYASTIFRTYLSPTVPPANLGIGLCLGPYGAGQCWATSIDLIKALNLCEVINQAISDALSEIDNAIQGAGESMFVMGGSSSSSNESDRDNAVGIVNYNLGKFQVKTGKQANYRISGFPKPITDWFSKQIDEVVNKLTDLPDIYIILPDVVHAFTPQSKFKDPQNIRDILTWLNSIPILNIETRKVTIKVPSISVSEINKYEYDAEKWINNIKLQLNVEAPSLPSIPNTPGLPTLPPTPQLPSLSTIDPKLRTEVEDMLSQVEQNLATLQEYKELFRKIRDYRAAQAKYISQIICYIDAVHQMLVGWIKTNELRLKAWDKAITTIKEKFDDWKLLIDVPTEYQESCDTCQTSRFTLTELIAKVFVVIPTPPIIQFPKWPDIILDFSKIEAGFNIIWPEVEFEAVPIHLPELPNIDLRSPRFSASYNVNITAPTLSTTTAIPSIPPVSGITIPAPPEIPEIPDIPLLPAPPKLPELPNLPPLPVVELPVLPKPPDIPEMHPSLKVSLKGIKIALKIWCLVKKGIIPTQETMLKGRFEQLAARNLDAVLPIDTMLKFNWPDINYEYLDNIEIIGRMNFSAKMDVNFIYNIVDQFADQWNKGVDESIDSLNNKFDEFSQTMQQSINDGLTPINNYNLDLNRTDSFDLNKVLYKEFEKISIISAQLNKEYATYPDKIESEGKVIASLPADHPSLNKDLSELAYKNDYYQNSPTLNNLTNLRNNMLAYARDIENNKFDFNNTYQLNKAIAKFNSEEAKLKASLTPFKATKSEEVKKFSMTEDEQRVKNQLDGKIIAQVSNSSSASAPQSTGSSSLNIKPKIQGIKIYNQALNINEQLINYIGEIDKKPQITEIDFDSDGDMDIVYGYGGDLYLKENFNTTVKKRYYSDNPSVIKLTDLQESISAQSKFKVTAVGNRNIDISWDKKEKASGYMIEIYDNLQFVSLPNKNADKFVHVIDFSNEFSQDGQSHKSKYTIRSFSSTVLMTGARRTYLTSSSPRTVISDGNIVQAFTDSTIFFDDNKETKLNINAGEYIVLSSDIINGSTDITVDGKIMLINPQSIIAGQQIRSGSLILPEDLIYVQSGRMDFSYLNKSFESPSYINIKNLEDINSPTVNLKLQNSNYYASIQSFDDFKNLSPASNTIILSPQICADKTAPVPNAGSSEREVPLFGTITLDSSGSFDSGSNITGYYYDLDAEVDSDKDGIPYNDKGYFKDIDNKVDSDFDGDPTNDMSDQKVTIGPFKKVENKKVALNVIDEVGNISTQIITIKVIIPQLTIQKDNVINGFSGSVSPANSNIPVTILRKRGNEPWKKIVVSNANKNGIYLTDEQGIYNASDLNNKDVISMIDANGNEIALINPETGTVNIKNSDYRTRVLPADKNISTRIEIVDKNDKIISTTYLVVDPNTDTELTVPDFDFTLANIFKLQGVTVKPLDPSYDYNFIPGNDIRFGGGIAISKNNQIVSRVLPDGNIYLYQPTFSLGLKKALSENDPLIITIKDSGKNIAEVYIPIDLNSRVEFNEQDSGIPDVPIYNPQPINKTQDSDGDGMPDIYEKLNGLNPKDATDRNKDQDKDGLTNYQEYIHNTDPNNKDTDGDGKSDYDEIQAGTNPLVAEKNPFTDISENSELFEITKKLKDLDIIQGYIQGGQSQFKPEQLITRAEYTKIILKILCIQPRPESYQSPALFGDVILKSPNEPWYYDEIKEAALRGLITGYLDEINPYNNLILFKPEQNINRAEATKIILEVLDKEKVITLEDVSIKEGQAWYEPYMNVSTNLTPYIIDPKAKFNNNYILTEKEAQNPSKIITRGEFAIMAGRVLNARNCYEDDLNQNNIPDEYEKLNNFDDINADNDNDGLTNLLEYNLGSNPNDPDTDKGGVKDGDEYLIGTNLLNPKDDKPFDFTEKPINKNDDRDQDGLRNIDEIITYGTDPDDADTDNGGVDDGTEIKRGTNPLYKIDDKDADSDGLSDSEENKIYLTDYQNPDTDNDGVGDGMEIKKGTDPLDETDGDTDPRIKLPQGINFSLPACKTCPCPVSLENKADIMPLDEVMSVIYDENNKKIYVRSNIIKIKNETN